MEISTGNDVVEDKLDEEMLPLLDNLQELWRSFGRKRIYDSTFYVIITSRFFTWEK
jgi:hypothetical protein